VLLLFVVLSLSSLPVKPFLFHFCMKEQAAIMFSSAPYRENVRNKVNVWTLQIGLNRKLGMLNACFRSKPAPQLQLVISCSSRGIYLAERKLGKSL